MIDHRQRLRSCTLLAAALTLLVSACAAASDDDASSTGKPTSGGTATSKAQPDRAGPVDVGAGREVFLECQGTGSPTVILESGFGDNAEIWNTTPTTGSTPESTPVSAAQPASAAQSATTAAQSATTVYRGVGEFTRVCAYDRPGTANSRSTQIPQPTSAQTSADDLDKLFSAAGEAQPYILVGHSYGGPIIEIFAGDHPDQVGGLVLVDALSEDLEAGLTADQQAIFAELNTPPTQPGAESVDLTTVSAQVRQAPSAPDVPVTVLSADTPQLTPQVLASGQLPPGVDQAFANALWTAQLAAQDKLAAKFPGAIHISDTHSDHYIQNGNPQLVVDSIHNLIDGLGTK